MRKTNSKRSGKVRKNPNRRDQEAIARDENPRILPSINDQLSTGFTLRFITTSLFGGVFSVTPANLLDAWFIAGTATVAYQLFDFVKVKKVTIRSMGIARPFSAGTGGNSPVATVGVEYFGLNAGTFGGGKQKNNTGMGYDEPAMVSLKPDPMSQGAQYQPSSGSSLFAVRAVDEAGVGLIGSIIDVDVVYRNSGDVNPATIGTARAGLTGGALYFGGLDGQPLATTQARSAFTPRA